MTLKAKDNRAQATLTGILARGDPLEVHSATGIFPMMPDAELRDLGKNIRAEGLKQAIVIYEDPAKKHWLLDGRDRLVAMEYAKIPFHFCYGGEFGWEIVIDDEDLGIELANFYGTIVVRDVHPVQYVLSANLHRRHLNTKRRHDAIAKVLVIDFSTALPSDVCFAPLAR